jgi:nitrile hydratase
MTHATEPERGLDAHADHDHGDGHGHVHVGSPSHMQDFEAHVRAVEEDLEYYRCKRFDSRIFLLHRRGLVTLYDIMKALPAVQAAAAAQPRERPTALEQRIRAVEDRLDDYIWGQAATSDVARGHTVIEDGRVERGDYDEAFRIAKKKHGGTLEERVTQLERDLDDYMLLLEAFTQALIDRGLATRERIEQNVAARHDGRSMNGARIVARAWVDPGFKQRLLEQGREAVRELSIPPGRLGKLGVAENTDEVHNVVVCTLCSCYPSDLLGETPWWYKHDSYKQQIVTNPRQTLQAMFDFSVAEDRRIRVYDSTSDVRWMVLPRRPAGTEGLSEEELARLITRESMIGVAEALTPAEAQTRQHADGAAG